VSTQRYQHLKPRVKSNASPYHSSMASRSKRDEKKNKEAEEIFKKLKTFPMLGNNLTL